MSRLVDDRSLREAFLEGQEAALTVVYHEYAPAVLSLVRQGFTFSSGGRRLRFAGCSQAADAENALQEIFMRAFSDRARRSYDGLRPYRAYLLAIARNVLIDETRTAWHRYVRLSSAEDCEAPVNEDQGVLELAYLEVEDLKRQILAFTNALDANERRIFTTRLLQGTSVERSAELVGVSEHRIKKSEKRLRKSFFLHMRQQGFFAGYRLDNVRGVAPETSLILLLLESVGAWS